MNEVRVTAIVLASREPVKLAQFYADGALGPVGLIGPGSAYG
jgi:hypothetical protein